MSTPAKDSLAAAIASVQLVDVRLQRSTTERRIRHPSELKTGRLVFNYGASLMGRTKEQFIVVAAINAFIVDGEAAPAEDSPVRISAAFELAYQLAGLEKFDDATLQQFAQSNGIFNAWSYWREFIQNSVARMNLPPLVLPLFRGEPSPFGRQPSAAEPTKPSVRRRAKR